MNEQNISPIGKRNYTGTWAEIPRSGQR